jgi:hypothetical protein
MARIALNCSCGWNFFIPGSTVGHEVTCPSCGQTVRIPGRKPGQPVPTSAGAIAAEKQRQQRAIKMMIGVGVVVVVVAGTILAFSMGSKPPEDPNEGRTKNETLTGLGGTPGNRPGAKKATSDSSNFELPPPPPPPPPLYNANQIQELRREVYSNVWQINMTVLLSECCRYRNLTNEWGQFQADIAKLDSRIKYCLGELGKVGEKLALEAYLNAGDQILGFVDKDFTKMKPGEAAMYLHQWLSNWRAGPNLAQCNIARGDKQLSVYLEFPEETKELLALVRHPALGELGNPNSGNVAAVMPLPTDLLKDINTRFDALPPGYRGYLAPADRKRFEDLSLAKRGSAEDIDWLRNQILTETIPSFQREADTIRSKVLELEPKLKENVATDVIFRKNAPKLECQIIQETETFVKVKSRFGSVTIQREDIERIEKGKGTAVEFPTKYAEAKGSLEKLVPLLAWCNEKGLKLEKEYVAYVVLTMDASNDKARTAVGLGRPTTPSGSAQPPKYPELNSSAKIEPVERTIELIANDVTNRNKIFSDVVQEMRRRTETLTTQVPPLAPERSIKGVSVISNPLTFKPTDLTGPMALEIGGWWGGLSPEDRRQFAKYYGLWCAFTRGQKR